MIVSVLAPAENISVELDEKEKQAIVKVPEDQLSLAIGREGQNVRLAAQLTGWRIEIAGVPLEAKVEDVEKVENVEKTEESETEAVKEETQTEETQAPPEEQK